MKDLRVGSYYNYPVARIVPLESRGPAWASFPLGAGLSSAATVGLPAGVLALIGAALSPLAIGVAGGFVFFCLASALLVCPPGRRTGSHLFATMFGIGHTLLLGMLGLAHFIPGANAIAVSILEGIPLLPVGLLLEGGLGAIAPLFLLAFVTFSVLAPVALVMFRYLVLRRDDPLTKVQ